MKYIILIMMSILLSACGNADPDVEDTENENTSGQEETGSVVLQDVEVETEDLLVSVTGEAIADKGEFYYRVEEEGDVIVEETHVSLEDPDDNWEEFDITLDLTDKYSGNEEPPVIVLYGKNDEGEMVNPNYIPIDV